MAVQSENGPFQLSMREKAAQLINTPFFQNFIMGVIVLNGIILGLETSATVKAAGFGHTLEILDTVCLWIFIAELSLAGFAYGFAYLKDPWRIFDTIVVGIALAPSGGSLSVLRGLRILRVLRLLNVAPSLKRIINAMVAAVPGMASICGLMVIVYYVAAVMATKLFAAEFPEWFGSIGASTYTLFQVMTLESWSMGIVRPVMEKFPYAWIFFVPFIILSTFTMLNLFVGVMVSAMQAAAETPEEERPVDSHSALATEADITRLTKELSEMRKLMEELVSKKTA